MRIVKLICLFLFVFSNQSFAKKMEAPATVKLVSGEIIKCILELPISNLSTRIVYREVANGKKSTIQAINIDFVVLGTKDDTFLIKNSFTYSTKGKKSKDKSWLLLKMYCNNFSTYLGVIEFTIGRDGLFYAIYEDGMGGYFIQSGNDDGATLTGYVFVGKIITQKSFDKQRQKFLLKYYENRDQEAFNWVKSKERISELELFNYLTSRC
ncbi:MAG: hypothetical protein ABI851_07620 [Saprospiraceae bacterium]